MDPNSIVIKGVHGICLQCTRSSVTISVSNDHWTTERENLSLGAREQHRRRPACASAQSDQSLCYSHSGKYQMLTCQRWNFNSLASLCSLGDWFESLFVRNPEDRFCHDEAHFIIGCCSTSLSKLVMIANYYLFTLFFVCRSPSLSWIRW